MAERAADAGGAGEAALVVLLGRPGSGKTSATEALAERPDVRVVRMSDLLKEAAARDTEHGRALRRQMASGRLVATAEVEQVLLERLPSVAEPVLVLDGFPRRLDQLEALDRLTGTTGRVLRRVVVFLLPRTVAEKRLTGRRVCPACGTVYNVYTDPPPADGCPCGGQPERRADDRPEVVQGRQDRYDKETAPVVRWFAEHRPEAVRCLRANRSPGRLRGDLLGVLDLRDPLGP